MKDKKLITNATQLLSELNKNFQSCKQGTADDIRLQELLNITSRRPSGLRKTSSSNNSLAHRTTWLRSDLGSLKLNDQARTSWRNYDKFHYEHVKHVLTLYEPVFGF